MSSRPQFDHEKLEVYQLELKFLSWVTDLLLEARSSQIVYLREVCDQLDRASLSALLNTAEGNGRRGSQQRARFFDDARGSATECAACLDAMVAKRACEAPRVEEGKGMLVRVVSMLCKLVERFDGNVSAPVWSNFARTRTSRRTITN
jgi:four helix bundle protein